MCVALLEVGLDELIGGIPGIDQAISPSFKEFFKGATLEMGQEAMQTYLEGGLDAVFNGEALEFDFNTMTPEAIKASLYAL